MKNIVFILVALTLSFTATAQQPFYNKVAANYEWKNGAFKKGLSFPTGCGVPARVYMKDSGAYTNMAAWYADSCNKKVYWFSPKDSTWYEAGKEVDSLVFSTRSYMKNYVDSSRTNDVKYADSVTKYVTPKILSDTSLSLRLAINNKLNISDTSLMLSPYLRKGDSTSLYTSKFAGDTAKQNIRNSLRNGASIINIDSLYANDEILHYSLKIGDTLISTIIDSTVIFGDSYTSSGLWSTPFTYGIGSIQINNGISGSGILAGGGNAMVNRISSIPTNRTTLRWLIFEYGINDSSDSTTFTNAYLRILDSAITNRSWLASKIILIAPGLTGSAYDHAYMVPWVQKIAQLRGAYFVDIRAYQLANGGLYNLSNDSLHPNASLGYPNFSRGIIKSLSLKSVGVINTGGVVNAAQGFNAGNPVSPTNYTAGDILIAADKKITSAFNSSQPNWYSSIKLMNTSGGHTNFNNTIGGYFWNVRGAGSAGTSAFQALSIVSDGTTNIGGNSYWLADNTINSYYTNNPTWVSSIKLMNTSGGHTNFSNAIGGYTFNVRGSAGAGSAPFQALNIATDGTFSIYGNSLIDSNKHVRSIYSSGVPTWYGQLKLMNNFSSPNAGATELTNTIGPIDFYVRGTGGAGTATFKALNIGLDGKIILGRQTTINGAAYLNRDSIPSGTLNDSIITIDPTSNQLRKIALSRFTASYDARYMALTGGTFTGNVTFAANGTPASGKIPTGTDGSGNWTWQIPATPANGSYTPILTNTSNITSSALNSAIYHQIGNVVHVAISVNITPTSAPSNTVLKLSLPVSGATSGSGVMVSASGGPTGVIQVATSTEVNLTFVAATTIVNTYYLQFDYSL